MKEAKKIPTNKDEAAPVEPPQEVKHTERIRSQVLARIGKPPRLDRVEVSQHHGNKYRVNIWQQPQSEALPGTDGPFRPGGSVLA